MDPLKKLIHDFIAAVKSMPPAIDPALPSPADLDADSARLAALIDHTLLKPEATPLEALQACDDARAYGFATVCLNSRFIPLASARLQGASARPITVVGFPLGAASTAAKAFEAERAVRDGAAEVDMVIALGALKAAQYAEVEADIRAVVEASRPAPVKVILETALLTHDEKIIACTLAGAAGAAFVKTSTGFAAGGATIEDVALMRRTVGPAMGVKASGGIRTRGDALRMIAAGANRIGTSASVAIVTGKNTYPESGY
jgi:deoxyribose-phosphate aldolase